MQKKFFLSALGLIFSLTVFFLSQTFIVSAQISNQTSKCLYLQIFPNVVSASSSPVYFSVSHFPESFQGNITWNVLNSSFEVISGTNGRQIIVYDPNQNTVIRAQSQDGFCFSEITTSASVSGSGSSSTLPLPAPNQQRMIATVLPPTLSAPIFSSPSIPQLLFSSPDNASTNVLPDSFLQMQFDTPLNLTTLNTSNIQLIENPSSSATQTNIQIVPMSSSFWIMPSEPPIFESGSSWSRISVSNLSTSYLNNSFSGPYAPQTGDIVFFQSPDFPPEIGIYGISDAPTGVNGYFLESGDRITRIAQPTVTGDVYQTGGSKRVNVGDLMVAFTSTDLSYSWHIVTESGDMVWNQGDSILLDSNTASPSFYGSSYSVFPPNGTATDNGAGSGGTLSAAVGDLVFAKLQSQTASTPSYAWHPVTTAGNLSSDSSENTAGLNGMSAANSRVVQGSQMSSISSESFGTLSGSYNPTLRVGDVIVAKTTSNAFRNGVYAFHMATREDSAGISGSNLRLDNTAASLKALTEYEIRANKNVRSAAGAALANDISVRFTTGGIVLASSIPASVQSTYPSSGNFSFPSNGSLEVYFSTAMKTSGAGSVLDSLNIGLYRDVYGQTGAQIIVSATYDSERKKAVLQPAANLDPNTDYILKIFSSVQSADSAYLDRNYFIYFRTSGTIDSTPPQVIGVYPVLSATNVSPQLNAVEAGFSEDINISTITSSTVQLLDDQGNSVSGTLRYSVDERIVYFFPGALLSPNKQYSFRITTGVKDSSGLSFAQNYISSFTTGSAPGQTVPTMVSGVADLSNVAVLFSEPMKFGGSIDSVDLISNYTLESPIGSSVSLVGKTVTYDNVSLTATISGLSLSNSNSFKLTIRNAKDMVGTAFQTGNGDLVYGTVQSSTPVTGGSGGYSGGGGTVGGATSDFGRYGFISVQASPSACLAQLTSDYSIQFPVDISVPAGGQIVLFFPPGFDVSGATLSTGSYWNSDINGSYDGKVQIASLTNNYSGRTVTLTTSGSATGSGVFLHIDLSGIVNTSVSSASGYKLNIKTRDTAASNRQVLEHKNSAAFYINAQGSSSLKIEVVDDLNANFRFDSGEPLVNGVRTSLYSSMTCQQSGITAGGIGAIFSNLPVGGYTAGIDMDSIFQQGYISNSWPEWVEVPGNVTKQFFVRRPVTSIQGTVSGVEGTVIDVYAYGIFGNYSWIQKSYTVGASGTVSYSLSVDPSATYKVGVYPGNSQSSGSYASGSGASGGAFVPPPEREVKVANASVSNIDFQLTYANKKINGRVTDRAGNGISGVYVYAGSVASKTGDQEVFGTSGESDSNGNFSLDVTPGTYLVSVYKSGLPYISDQKIFVPQSGINVPASLTFQFDLLLSLTIAGRVLDASGNPISYAAVWGRLLEDAVTRTVKAGGSNNEVSGITNMSGNYVLYVSSGTWEIEAYAPGFGKFPAQIINVTNSSVIGKDFSLTQLSNGKITGKAIYGTDGKSGVQVYASGVNGWNSTVTDTAGNYSLEVPSGTYTVSCWFPDVGDSPPIQNIQVASNQTVSGKDCAVFDFITVSVQLTDGATGLSGALIELSDTSGRSNNTNISEISGIYSVYSLKVPRSAYALHISHPKYGFITEQTNIADSTLVTVTAPSRLYTLSGAVVANGVAVSDAWVTIIGRPKGSQNLVHLGLYTDSRGIFSMDVPDGAYSLRVDKDSFISPPEKTFEINGRPFSDITLVMVSALRNISGVVRLNGQGLSNVLVESQNNAGGYLVTETDSNGNFSLSVSDGTWNVKAYTKGFESAILEITFNGQGSVSNILNLAPIAGYVLKKEEVSTLTPSAGGVIFNDDLGDKFKVTIPANAIGSSSNPATMRTQPNNAMPTSVSGTVLKSNGVSINAVNSSGSPVKNLTGDATVILPYDTAQLPVGSNEMNLFIAVWNSVTKNYDLLPTTVDRSARTLTARTSHFSDFVPLLPVSNAPSTPMGFSASNEGSGTKINLSWNSVSAGGGNSAAGSYNIYRSADNLSFVKIASSNTNSYQVIGLNSGQQYWFQVSAVSQSQAESVLSNVITFTPSLIFSIPAPVAAAGGGGGGVFVGGASSGSASSGGGGASSASGSSAGSAGKTSSPSSAQFSKTQPSKVQPSKAKTDGFTITRKPLDTSAEKFSQKPALKNKIFNSDLRLGDKGLYVESLQQFLWDKGFYRNKAGKVLKYKKFYKKGVFDKATSDALILYQKKKRLSPTGILDKKTREKIVQEYKQSSKRFSKKSIPSKKIVVPQPVQNKTQKLGQKLSQKQRSQNPTQKQSQKTQKSNPALAPRKNL